MNEITVKKSLVVAVTLLTSNQVVLNRCNNLETAIIGSDAGQIDTPIKIEAILGKLLKL